MLVLTGGVGRMRGAVGGASEHELIDVGEL